MKKRQTTKALDQYFEQAIEYLGEGSLKTQLQTIIVALMVLLIERFPATPIKPS